MLNENNVCNMINALEKPELIIWIIYEIKMDIIIQIRYGHEKKP